MAGDNVKRSGYTSPMLIDQTLSGRTILLVITGGIAAYKTPDLVRRMREPCGCSKGTEQKDNPC